MMKHKIGDVIKIKNENDETLKGKYLVIKTKLEKPTEKDIIRLTGKHNILNLVDLIKNSNILIKDYTVVEVIPSPYPIEIDKPNMLTINENQIV